MNVRALLAWLIACAPLAACSSGPTAQRCHLVEEKTLYLSGASRLHAIALARGPHGLLAAWSDEDGLRTAVLAYDGRLLHGPTRVRFSKAASLDAVPAGDGFLLGILEPADLFTAGGGAYLARLDARGTIQAVERVGDAGAYSKHIAVATTGGPSGGAVAWHDGGPGVFAVRAWAGGATREIARGRMGALAPAITAAPDGSLALAWVELEGRADGGVDAPIRFARFAKGLRPLGGVSTVTRTSIEDADPVLIADGRRFAVFFRDVRKGDRRTGYFFTRVGQRTPAVHVARANGPHGPDVARCHDTWAGAAVRTYSKDLLLGFNRFDETGTKRSGELQIYSDKVHFADVELECLPRGWALLYTEEHAQGGRVLFNEVTCSE